MGSIVIIVILYHKLSTSIFVPFYIRCNPSCDFTSLSSIWQYQSAGWLKRKSAIISQSFTNMKRKKNVNICIHTTWLGRDVCSAIRCLSRSRYYFSQYVSWIYQSEIHRFPPSAGKWIFDLRIVNYLSDRSFKKHIFMTPQKMYVRILNVTTLLLFGPKCLGSTTSITSLLTLEHVYQVVIDVMLFAFVWTCVSEPRYSEFILLADVSARGSRVKGQSLLDLGRPIKNV